MAQRSENNVADRITNHLPTKSGWPSGLRSGRSRALPAWVRIPLLTKSFCVVVCPGAWVRESRHLDTIITRLSRALLSTCLIIISKL